MASHVYERQFQTKESASSSFSSSFFFLLFESPKEEKEMQTEMTVLAQK